jgi:hypothetical protein
VSFETTQPEALLASTVPATATAQRADVVIGANTLARWELLARSVESALAQEVAPQQLIIVGSFWPSSAPAAFATGPPKPSTS